jgi:hypothetical protein
MAKKRTKHCRLHLPKLDGSKKAKARYDHAYYLKVASKKRRRK